DYSSPVAGTALASLVDACRGQRLAVEEEEHGRNQGRGRLPGRRLARNLCSDEQEIEPTMVRQGPGGEFARTSPPRHLPQPQGAVRASADQDLSIRREGQAPNSPFLRLVPAELPARGYLPEQHRRIPLPARGQDLAARGEGETENALGMPFQAAEFLARGGVPETDARLLLPRTECPCR